jgi:hypothetical protein
MKLNFKMKHTKVILSNHLFHHLITLFVLYKKILKNRECEGKKRQLDGKQV